MSDDRITRSQADADRIDDELHRLWQIAERRCTESREWCEVMTAIRHALNAVRGLRS